MGETPSFKAPASSNSRRFKVISSCQINLTYIALLFLGACKLRSTSRRKKDPSKGVSLFPTTQCRRNGDIDTSRHSRTMYVSQVRKGLSIINGWMTMTTRGKSDYPHQVRECIVLILQRYKSSNAPKCLVEGLSTSFTIEHSPTCVLSIHVETFEINKPSRTGFGQAQLRQKCTIPFKSSG